MPDKEFRVSFESADPHQVNAVEMQYGKKCWSRLPEWPEMRWAPIENVTSDGAAARDQYETLKQWEDNREEPVRNVKLEVRSTADWEEQ